ncbi:MFS transporter [Marinomonas sp. MED121]|uniref:MFS transporter n=1 Tax=Marinomonas sp. MED121 TaxID=314277 RepID=UPI000569A8B0|nr:MFS transporter [Marinomonas sp. MED121]
MKRLSKRATKRFSWPIFTLLSLNGITILGNALTEVAIPWLILEISDSPGLVAAVMSAKILPIILSTFFSAPLVDNLVDKSAALKHLSLPILLTF